MCPVAASLLSGHLSAGHSREDLGETRWGHSTPLSPASCFIPLLIIRKADGRRSPERGSDLPEITQPTGCQVRQVEDRSMLQVGMVTHREKSAPWNFCVGLRYQSLKMKKLKPAPFPQPGEVRSSMGSLGQKYSDSWQRTQPGPRTGAEEALLAPRPCQALHLHHPHSSSQSLILPPGFSLLFAWPWHSSPTTSGLCPKVTSSERPPSPRTHT